MPGRRPELHPLKSGPLLTLLTCLLVARPATGQTPRDSESAGGRISLIPELAITRLAGEWVPAAGATVSLRLASWIALGAGARVGLDHPTVVDAGSIVRLRFGYGGLRVALRPVSSGPTKVVLSLLAGAGNVDVQERSVGAVIDSDNGVVLEPAVTVARVVGSHVVATASLSWRITSGFEGVGGIDSSTLRGPGLALGNRARAVLTSKHCGTRGSVGVSVHPLRKARHLAHRHRES